MIYPQNNQIYRLYWDIGWETTLRVTVNYSLSTALIDSKLI